MQEPTNENAGSSLVTNTTSEIEARSEPLPPPASPIRTEEVTPPQSSPSIDAISKMLALAVVFLYLSGFLITSLHNFQYGFSEMNPLRPRILAAGGWIAVFTFVPFALVWELRTHLPSIRSESRVIRGHFGVIVVYMGSASLLLTFAVGLFAFQSTPATDHWMAVTIIATGFSFLVLMFSYSFRLFDFRFARIFGIALIVGWLGTFFAGGLYEILFRHQFTALSLNFWLLLLGIFVYFELCRRDWTLSLRGWQLLLVELFAMLTLFATVYYPHIMAKWGGGTLIPVEITLAKDVTTRSGSFIECSLIDETDSGFYVIAKDDSFATFLPRAEVSSIYYGRGNTHLAITGISTATPSPTNTSAPGNPTEPSLHYVELNITALMLCTCLCGLQRWRCRDYSASSD